MRMILSRPVCARQARMRCSVASDPDEQNRTRSADGTASHTSRASSSWYGVS